jgi:hypothetical protein
MFEDHAYLRVLSSVCAALTTLLGSVGIFVSLTVQRRVEKLQDILEEFLDLSYHGDTNITGKMYKLIEKYQMHYLFPATPGRMIVQYINLTIIVVILSWLSILAIGYRYSTERVDPVFLMPMVLGLGILVFYRYLLKNVIFPFGNNLMSPLIPPPIQLRSVSFLSHYVNVSVKSILRQARLRLLIKTLGNNLAQVILKEELSFDDYIYYLLILANDQPVFAAYGELVMEFGYETITGKPIPAAKNINIPLGCLDLGKLSSELYEARLFIFPRGEKHPLEYYFSLQKQDNIVTMAGEPEISVNYMITYKIDHNRLEIINESAELPFFRRLMNSTILAKKRYACSAPFTPDTVIPCNEEIYID